MAGVKKGTLTRPPQWWRHLRDWKRVFWKSERKAHKKEIKNERTDQMDNDSARGTIICVLSYHANGWRVCCCTLLFDKVWIV